MKGTDEKMKEFSEEMQKETVMSKRLQWELQGLSEEVKQDTEVSVADKAKLQYETDSDARQDGFSLWRLLGACITLVIGLTALVGLGIARPIVRIVLRLKRKLNKRYVRNISYGMLIICYILLIVHYWA